ncbi:MAG: DUF4160 domain-containing protein [Arcicella sp.]|jgi:hypothetical protein|nr:DUF4160 domain-containing protein [Arcicella sp.]
MPEIFRFFGIRFFYFSNDHLPIHVHVKNADGTAKFEIKPVRLVESDGMKKKELRIAEDIIKENEDIIEAHWKDYFGDNLEK